MRPGVKVFWYDGGVLPGYNLVGGKKEVADEIFKMKDGGTLWIGEKGKLLAPYGEAPQWVGEAPKNFEPSSRYVGRRDIGFAEFLACGDKA